MGFFSCHIYTIHHFRDFTWKDILRRRTKHSESKLSVTKNTIDSIAYMICVQFWAATRYYSPSKCYVRYISFYFKYLKYVTWQCSRWRCLLPNFLIFKQKKKKRSCSYSQRVWVKRSLLTQKKCVYLPDYLWWHSNIDHFPWQLKLNHQSSVT